MYSGDYIDVYIHLSLCIHVYIQIERDIERGGGDRGNAHIHFTWA